MNDIVGNISVTLPMLTVSMTAKSRANFTHYHQESALLNAQLAIELESGQDQTKSDEIVKTRYIAHTSSSIISTCASLESKINEYIVDHLEKIQAKVETVDINTFKNIKKIKTNKDIIKQLEEETSTILKHKLLYKLLESAKFSGR
jgi:hypothetical protein